MKAHRIATSMSVILLATSLLSAVGSKSYAADPCGVPRPSGKHWTVTFEDDFTKDREIDKGKWNGGELEEQSVLRAIRQGLAVGANEN